VTTALRAHKKSSQKKPTKKAHKKSPQKKQGACLAFSEWAGLCRLRSLPKPGVYPALMRQNVKHENFFCRQKIVRILKIFASLWNIPPSRWIGGKCRRDYNIEIGP